MLSSFKQFVGNRDMVARFLQAARQDRVPPVVLFSGPEGVGKKTFALLAAQYLNCQDPGPDAACGRCGACRRIARTGHPDVRLIVPDGSQIKIEQMRELSADLQFRPVEATRKVYILDQAEKLNEAATNSMLKTLEECPGYAWIVLVTAHPNALLPTVRSRCPVYRFAPVAPAEIEPLLVEQGVERSRAAVLARLCGGCVARARQEDWEQFDQQRRRALSLLEHLTEPAGFHAVHRFWSALATEERTRTEVEALLGTLLFLLRDLMLLGEGRPADITHADIVSRLEKIAGRFSFQTIARLEAQMGNALRELQRNVNTQILVESLYFER
ncbi:MAG: DNA polymerase III subunit delta' [Acidobacteria bacterium]|nr:DNA polymerase III subunit delta' [Acidobacteriota bacterium]